jgi:DNA-binding beta-propeller fold protein YncE
MKAAILLLWCAASAVAADCNAAAKAASVTLPVPGQPFSVVVSADGCSLFVSLPGSRQIAVLRRSDGQIQVARVAPLQFPPTGMALTHDGKLLVVAAQDAVLFLDAAKLVSGSGDPLAGSIRTGNRPGSVYVNVTPDDRLAFVSEEGAASISAIGLEHKALLGSIPVGMAPIALTFSKDGRYLYTTSEGARPDWKWPTACTAEGRGSRQLTRPEGAIVVIDVERAGKEPAEAVAARVPAGCSPVRLAMAPDGNRVYVTARNSNAVLAFDAAKLVSDGAHARVGSVAVGAAPVPIAVVDGGRKVVAGNSNRFGGDTPQELVVIDAAKLSATGTVPAGAFPRDMAVSADGRTLFLTNFGSKTVQMLDVARLP